MEVTAPTVAFFIGLHCRLPDLVLAYSSQLHSRVPTTHSAPFPFTSKEETMPESAAARATEQLAEQARKFAKAKDQVAEVVGKNLEEATATTKRAFKRGREMAEDAIDDTGRLIKRHPFESVGTTLAVGFVAGLIVGLMIHRD